MFIFMRDGSFIVVIVSVFSVIFLVICDSDVNVF